MRVIGGHHADAELAPEAKHAFGDLTFLADAVLLDLEPEPVGSECPAEPLGALACLFELALPQVQRNFPGQLCDQANQPLGMLGQPFLVDPRPTIKSFDEA